jgi:hypothetical protein
MNMNKEQRKQRLLMWKIKAHIRLQEAERNYVEKPLVKRAPHGGMT